MKLSESMLGTLCAINFHSGTAHGIGGGWWQGNDGEALEIAAHSNGPLKGYRVTVQAPTIFALERRGLLKRLFTDGRRNKDTYRITEAGREALSRHNVNRSTIKENP